jgi:hypothetical protein
MATGTLILAAVAAVIVFFPAEGQVMAPLHNALDVLLGAAAFVIPLGLALAGALCLARYARPQLNLPKRRFAGLALMALSVIAGDRLLGASTGVVGEWFTQWLIDLIGGPLTAVLVVGFLSAGAVLTFDVRKVAVAAR